MRRIVARCCLAAAGLLLALLLLLYTPPGLRLVGRLAGPLSGGQVRVVSAEGTWVPAPSGGYAVKGEGRLWRIAPDGSLSAV